MESIALSLLGDLQGPAWFLLWIISVIVTKHIDLVASFSVCWILCQSWWVFNLSFKKLGMHSVTIDFIFLRDLHILFATLLKDFPTLFTNLGHVLVFMDFSHDSLQFLSFLSLMNVLVLQEHIDVAHLSWSTIWICSSLWHHDRLLNLLSFTLS